jgi:hypothetical protein
MHNAERWITGLRYKLGLLRTALEFASDSTARDRVFARINACVTEYTQLVEERLVAVIPADALTERHVGDATQSYSALH